MDYFAFKRYFLGDDIFSSHLNKNEEKYWSPIRKIYNDIENPQAVVDKQHGFWETVHPDSNVLVVGYTLNSKKNIFRPIYSYSRNKLMNNILNMIKDRIGNGLGSDNGYGVNIGGGKFMLNLRQNMAKKVMLCFRFRNGKSIPADIICLIGDFV